MSPIRVDWEKWHKVSVHPEVSLLERKAWCKDHCKSPWIFLMFAFRFEDPKEAIAFKLVFGG